MCYISYMELHCFSKTIFLIFVFTFFPWWLLFQTLSLYSLNLPSLISVSTSYLNFPSTSLVFDWFVIKSVWSSVYPWPLLFSTCSRFMFIASAIRLVWIASKLLISTLISGCFYVAGLHTNQTAVIISWNDLCL